MKTLTSFAMISIGLLVTTGSSQADFTLYQQASDFPIAGRSSLLASQIDTTAGGFGAFATSYDNFSLASAASVSNITWQGGYYAPALSGPPSLIGFVLKVYQDSAGKPGTVLDTFNVGTSNETFIGLESNTAQGTGLIFNYSANMSSFNLGAGKYWLSIVAELPYQSTPPFTVGQWGWHTGTGGDGSSLQSIMGGAPTTQGHDLAFSISGAATVPEPTSVLMLSAGLSLVGIGAIRRRRSKNPGTSPGQVVA